MRGSTFTGHCCDRPVKRVQQLRLVQVEREELWGRVSSPALICSRCLRAIKAGAPCRFVLDELVRLSRNPDEAA